MLCSRRGLLKRALPMLLRIMNEVFSGGGHRNGARENEIGRRKAQHDQNQKLPARPGTPRSRLRGKFLILVMLGFTATDFIFTRTVSVAAAAEHLIHNPEPHWQWHWSVSRATVRELWGVAGQHLWRMARRYGDQQLAVTLVLLLISGILS